MISQFKEKLWQEEGRNMFIYHTIINCKGVRKPHTCKQVQLKIEHIEQKFWSAHNWASHTGQGIEEDDPSSFCAAVEKRCQYYFDLLEIFSDCASVQPQIMWCVYPYSFSLAWSEIEGLRAR